MKANHARWAAVATVLGTFVFYITTQTRGVRAETTDWAMYVMHARNLVEGLPYASTGYVFQPESTTEVGANSYPSGFPLLIAPLIAAKGIDIGSLKLLNAAFLAFSLLPTWWLARRTLPPGAAIAVLWLVGFSMPFAFTYDLIGSDAPYQVLSLLVLVHVQRTFDEGWNETRPWRTGTVTGVGVAVSYLFRPFGLAILLAVCSAELLKRRKLTAFHAAIILAVIPFAAINNLVFHRDDSYAYQFTLSPGAVFEHVVANLKLVSYVFANPLSHPLRYVTWAIALPLMAWAYVARLRRGPSVSDWYVLFMAGVLAVYWDTNYHYLVPLMPFIAIYLAEGIGAVATRFSPRHRAAAAVLAAALILVAPMLNLLLLRPDARNTLVTAPTFEALAERIRQETPAGSYMVFWNPRVLTLSTDRKASGWPADSSTAHLGAWVKRIGANYVIADTRSPRGDAALLALTSVAPAAFEVVYANDQFTMIRVIDAAASSPAH